MKARHASAAALALAGGSLAVLVGTRRWHQHWGATDEEIAQPLPGDDLIPEPKLDSPRPSPSTPPSSKSGPGCPRPATAAAPASTATTSWSGASGPATPTGSTRTLRR